MKLPSTGALKPYPEMKDSGCRVAREGTKVHWSLNYEVKRFVQAA